MLGILRASTSLGIGLFSVNKVVAPPQLRGDCPIDSPVPQDSHESLSRGRCCKMREGRVVGLIGIIFLFLGVGVPATSSWLRCVSVSWWATVSTLRFKPCIWRVTSSQFSVLIQHGLVAPLLPCMGLSLSSHFFFLRDSRRLEKKTLFSFFCWWCSCSLLYLLEDVELHPGGDLGFGEMERRYWRRR